MRVLEVQWSRASVSCMKWPSMSYYWNVLCALFLQYFWKNEVLLTYYIEHFNAAKFSNVHLI